MTVFSANKPQRGSFLVYINGVEVPVIDVSVTSGIWRIPEAVINMPPDKELIGLGKEDRVQVAIFYLDSHHTETVTNTDPDPTFRLLFDGEIRGWEYQTTGLGRTISFHCTSHVDAFTKFYPFFVSNLDSMVAGALSSKTNQGHSAESQLTFPASIFYRGLRINGETEFVKRPFDFIENVFKALIGKDESLFYNGTTAKTFFGRWTRLTGFLNRWAPCPLFETTDLVDLERGIFPILKAAQSEVAIKTLQQRANALGNNSSFWTYINLIYQLMYYEFHLNPAPAAVSYDLPTGKILGKPKHVQSGDASRNALENPLKPTRLLNYVTKPQLLFCVPPMCNTFFPSMIKSFGLSEDYSTQVTRTYISGESQLQHWGLSHNDSLYRVMNSALTQGFPEEVRDAVNTKKINKAYNHYNLMRWPEEFFKGPVLQTKSAPSWFLYLYNAYKRDTDTGVEQANVELPFLCSMYAEYEHYRERATHQSGAVQLVFDPYVVAGYPCTILDHPDTAVHSFAYVMNVTHRLTQSEMSTAVQYTFAQTFEEFFTALRGARQNIADSVFFKAEKDQVELLRYLTNELEQQVALGATERQAELDDYKRKLAHLERQFFLDRDVTAAPISPIPDIRTRFQTKLGAEEFYRQVFHRGEITKKPAGFHWEDNIGILNENSNKVDPDVQSISFVESVGKVSSNAVPADGDSSPIFQAKKNIIGEVKAHDRAMRTISRSICSLEEYIDFQDSFGIRDTLIPTHEPKQGKGAPYYKRILNFRPNNEEPDFPDEPKSTTHGNRLAASTVETRKNWTARLLRYRNKVLNEKHPHNA